MEWFKKHKVLTVVGVLVLLAIIVGSSGGDKTSTSTATQPAQSVPAATADQAATQPAKPEATKVSLQEFYDKITNGMSKAEVLAISGGREADNCSESQGEYIGKMEFCSYGGFSESGMVSVTYSDAKVSNKSINKF